MKTIVIVLITILFASCDVLFIEDISDDKIITIAPHDGAELAKGTVVFNWETIEAVDRYQLQIAIPSFEKATKILLDTTVVNNTYKTSLGAGDYEWRLRGLNSEYTTAYQINVLKIN